MSWRQWLSKGSTPVLVIGALAASANFVLDFAEKGWRLRKEITAPEPPRAAIRIESQGPALTFPATAELLKIPSIRGALELQVKFVKLLKALPADAPSILQHFTVRPLHVLVRNPTKERLTLHTCRSTISRGSSLFVSRSIGYFLSEDIHKVRANEFNPLVAVNPDDVRRIEALFIFPYVPSVQGYGLKEELKSGGVKGTSSLGELELQCEDQAGRPLSDKVPGVAEAPKPAGIPRPGR